MILFRPNEHGSRELVRRRSKSVGSDLDMYKKDHVELDEGMVGRVLEAEYEWRQL